MVQGDLFKNQRKVLFGNQKKAAEYFRVFYLTICKWEKSFPKFSADNKAAMIKDGINPSYSDGLGNMILPDWTVDDVVNAIDDRIARIKSTEVTYVR